MMRKIILLLFLANSVLHAQEVLKGKVFLAENKKMVAGAHVNLPDLNKGVLTDENGNYRIENLPAGEFLVECRFNNKYYLAQIIRIGGETELNFELAEAVLEIQELTVTGSAQSEFLKNNPIAIKVLDQKSLFEQSSSNLIESLSKEPGISQISTGSAISKPVIRGLGYNRIVTLQNGLRQEGQQWGDEHGIEIDEFSVDKIEIIKGPGSLLYGSDALAGVVNFISPDPLPSGKIKTTFTGGFQSNNKLQSYSISNAGNLNGFNWLLRGSYKKAGNYQNRFDGYVYNSGFEEKDLNATIGINRKWGFSNLQFSTFNQTVAMPEGERDSTGKFIRPVIVNDSTLAEEQVPESILKVYAVELPSQQIGHHRLVSTTRFFGRKFNITLKVGAQQNNRREFADLFEPETPELFFTLNTLNYDIKINFSEINKWKFTLGAGGMFQENTNKAEEYIIPDYNLMDNGGFVFVKKEFNSKFAFSGGIRFDNRSISIQELYLDSLGIPTEVTAGNFQKFQGQQLSFNAFTGSAGITSSLSEKVLFKFNLARGYRAPSISEIAANGKHEGALRYEIGNPDLKPESSLQADAGIGINTSHLTVELAGFYNSIQNYIYIQKLTGFAGADSIVDVDDPAPAFQFTQGNAQLFGGEFSMDLHPHPLDWLHIENSFSMVYGKQKNMPDTMTNLPFIPAPRYQGELRCEFERESKRLSNFYLSVALQHYFEQSNIYSAFGTETITPAYSLLNMGVGFTFSSKRGNTIATVVLNATNITDVAYQNHLSRLKYAPENLATGRNGIYNMGRNFGVKILIPLEFTK